MKLPWLLIRSGAWFVPLLPIASVSFAEDLTVTTYYPSPRGVYEELRTLNNTFLATQPTGNVGVGTTTPGSKLSVKGGVAIGTTYAAVGPVPAGSLLVEGLLGVGTTTPVVALDVMGPTAVRTAINIRGDSAEGGELILNAQNDSAVGERPTSWALDNYPGGLFRLFYGTGASGTLALAATPAGRVGIGTTTPGAKLDIAGNIKIVDGTQGANKVLTSDASGLASWQPGGIPAGAVMFFNLPACPAGWSALAAASGRYLVGLPAGGTLNGVRGQALSNLEDRPTGRHSHTGTTDTAGLHTHQYYHMGVVFGQNVGGPMPSGRFDATSADGEHPHTFTTDNSVGPAGTNAPYLQLLVCQKN